MDFTLRKYRQLLQALKGRDILLRHDVDRRPANSLAPVHSACMHGSPQSRWDNKDIWEKYDYKSVGIDFEPYLDCDFSKYFYLTDTGRRWDGSRFSVRDKIPQSQNGWAASGLVYHSTDDIIRAAADGTLPQRIMINVHPQRWTDSLTLWIVELTSQKIKNYVKFILNRANGQK